MTSISTRPDHRVRLKTCPFTSEANLPLSRGSTRFALNSLRVFAVGLLAAVETANAVIAADVTATRLDGTTVSGELRGWNESQIVIAAQTGEQHIANDQLMSL